MKKYKITCQIWDSKKCDYIVGNDVYTWDGKLRTGVYYLNGTFYMNRRKIKCH